MKSALTSVAIALVVVAGVRTTHAQDLGSFLDEETIELAETYDKRLRYTPSTVSIFDADDIRRSGALDLAELLERVVGIHVTRKEFGSSATQFVRGLDNNLLILHNGVEIAKQIPELLAMPLNDVTRVEVVKGSHYPLYGASAVSGTVNIVTNGPVQDELAGGVRAGSLDTARVWVRRSDVVERIGYSAYLSATRTRTTEGTIAADRQTAIDELLGTDASLAPGEGHFDADYVDARLTLELGDRWTLRQFVASRTLGTGVGLAQALDPSGREHVSRYTSDLRFDSPLGSGSFEARVIYNRTQAEYVDTRLLPPGTLGGTFPEGVTQSYGQTGQQLFAEALYRVVLGEHTLDLGIGGSRGEVDNDFDRRNYVFTSGSELPIPLGETIDFSDSEPLFRDDYAVTTAHLILRDEWQLSATLSAHIGARLDRSTDYGTFVNPRVGLDWIAGQYTNVSLLYGESAFPPSEIQQTSNGLFSPLGSDELDPAKIRLLELAIDHDFRNGVSLATNLFAYRQEDEIGVVPDATAPIGTRFDNLDEQERGHGAEVLLGWQATPRVHVSLGGAVQRTRSDDLGNTGAPEFQPYAELDVGPSDRWTLNAAAIGVAGREREPGDGRPAIDDYTVVNVSAIREGFVLDRLDLSLSAQNVFGVDAREDISSAIPFDLPVYPRRVLLGLSYSR